MNKFIRFEELYSAVWQFWNFIKFWICLPIYPQMKLPEKK